MGKIEKAVHWKLKNGSIENEYTIGIEVVQGEEHAVDETSVDAMDEEGALRHARDLTKEWYPKADSVFLKVLKCMPMVETFGAE